MKKRVFRERNNTDNVVIAKEKNINEKPVKKATTKKKVGK